MLVGFISFSMASPTLFSLPLFYFFLLLLPCCRSNSFSVSIDAEPPPVPTRQPPPEIIGLIREACKASNDTTTCVSSLTEESSRPPTNATLMNIIQSALWLSSETQNNAISMVHDLMDSSPGNKNLTVAANHCLVGLIYGNYRTGLTADALPRGGMKDARAWMSATSGYQVGCATGFKNINKATLKLNETVSFLEKLVVFTNNVLSMMMNYDNFGEETTSWGPPKTERDGFWERVEVPGEWSSPAFTAGVPPNEEANVTVCEGVGQCSYEKVQDAVDVAPTNSAGKRFVIWIKAGVYDEIVRVPLEKKNVVFVGDGMGKTVITGSLNVGIPGISTFDSATIGVAGDGFMARDLTIQNTAGSLPQQAVAFRSSSDHSILENCEFIGHQDTLYPHSLRQFYKSCRIQGNVDFIFGNAAAVFQDCLLLVSPRQNDQEKGETNAITAHGRNIPAQSTGFVFQNCIVNGTEEYMSYYHKNPKVHKTYLGRPWKQFSRTVFINCTLEELISPEGWLPWSGDFALDTLYYGEFQNNGPGARASRRVPWGCKIPAQHVNTYSIQNFIQGERNILVPVSPAPITSASVSIAATISNSTSKSSASDSVFNKGILLTFLAILV